jgi:hypothetical protein
VCTFAPVMDICQSALFFTSLSNSNFAFINICLYSVPPSVFLVVLLVDFLRIIVKYLTYFCFAIRSNIINPIQTDMFWQMKLYLGLETPALIWCFSDRASWIDYILITNLMQWLLFINKIFSSTCFEQLRIETYRGEYFENN